MSKSFAFFEGIPPVPERGRAAVPSSGKGTKGVVSKATGPGGIYKGVLFGRAAVAFHGCMPCLQQPEDTGRVSPRVKELLSKRPSGASLKKHIQTLSAFRVVLKKTFRRCGALFVAGAVACLSLTIPFMFIAHAMVTATSTTVGLPVFLIEVFIDVLILSSLIALVMILSGYGVFFLSASFSEEQANRLLDEYSDDVPVAWVLRKARAPFGAEFNEKHLVDFEREELDNEELYRLSLLPSAKAYLDSIRKSGGSGPFTHFDAEALRKLAEEDVKRGAAELVSSSMLNRF